MRITDYSNFSRANHRTVREAVEAWEAANGVDVHVIGFDGGRSVIPEDDTSEVRFVVGYLPEDENGNRWMYQTFDEVDLPACTVPTAGYVEGTCYDMQVPTPEQVMAHGIELLPWEVTYLSRDGGREVMPSWYINRDEATLYCSGLHGYFLSFKPEIITSMLDELLFGLGDPEARQLLAIERASSALTSYYAEGASADLRNLRDDINSDVRNLATWEQSALQVRQNLRDKQARLDLLLKQSQSHDAAAEARAAFVQMQDHPQIDSVRFMGQQLFIETAGLDIEHPTTGHSAYLGKFSVTLNVQSGDIKLKNLDNARNGHDHPHVNMGRPCFGEMGNTIMELIRAGQLLAAIEMVFVFLSTANIRDDWGRTLAYWMEPQLTRPADPITDTAHEFELVEA